MNNQNIHIENSLLNSFKAFVGSHFLLNIINSIQSDIILKKNQEGFELIQKFNRLYKAAIRASNTQTHDVSDEVEFVKDYLSLEQTRTSRVIPTLRAQIEGMRPVPTFVIQCLVENALYWWHEDKTASLTLSLDSSDQRTVFSAAMDPLPYTLIHPKVEAKTLLALNRFETLNELGLINGQLEWEKENNFFTINLT